MDFRHKTGVAEQWTDGGGQKANLEAHKENQLKTKKAAHFYF
jgi:hypothetical protein